MVSIHFMQEVFTDHSPGTLRVATDMNKARATEANDAPCYLVKALAF